MVFLRALFEHPQAGLLLTTNMLIGKCLAYMYGYWLTQDIGGGGGGANAILGYFRPYLSRAIFGFLRCTWPKIALKLKQVNICSSN